MLQNLLKTCGLNQSEQIVLLDLIEHGSSLASVISRRTGVKRPTVYAALANLADLGLLTEQKRTSGSYFQAVQPQLIANIFQLQAEEAYRDVEQAANALVDPLEKLQEFVPEQMGGFSVKTLQSIEAVYQQLGQAFAGEGFSAIFNPQYAFDSKRSQAIVQEFVADANCRQASIREIAVSGPKTDWYRSQINNPNHQLREISADVKVMSDMIFADGSVYLLHYTLQEGIGVEIRHTAYYQSMLAVFEELWGRI